MYVPTTLVLTTPETIIFDVMSVPSKSVAIAPGSTNVPPKVTVIGLAPTRFMDGLHPELQAKTINGEAENMKKIASKIPTTVAIFAEIEKFVFIKVNILFWYNYTLRSLQKNVKELQELYF
jgi:hypothetical protein